MYLFYLLFSVGRCWYSVYDTNKRMALSFGVSHLQALHYMCSMAYAWGARTEWARIRNSLIGFSTLSCCSRVVEWPLSGVPIVAGSVGSSTTSLSIMQLSVGALRVRSSGSANSKVVVPQVVVCWCEWSWPAEWQSWWLCARWVKFRHTTSLSPWWWWGIVSASCISEQSTTRAIIPYLRNRPIAFFLFVQLGKDRIFFAIL